MMSLYRGAGVCPNGFARLIIISSACAVVCGLFAAPAFAKSHFTKFRPDGATWTAPGPINASAAVGGVWQDANGFIHAFTRSPDGTISPFDGGPGALQTYVNGLNDSGEAVGTFVLTGFDLHGFVRTPDGTLSVYDAPGSNGYTAIEGINASNVFSGYYRGNDFNIHGFVQSPDGTFVSLYPVKKALSAGRSTTRA